MKTLTAKITAVIASLFMLSCAAVQEEATAPTPESIDLSVLLELVNYSWQLDTCPGNSSLNIDGYSACDYMKRLSFTEESVYVRHGNNSYFTKHNICFVDGGVLTISRQGCGFTEWNGVVEMRVISYSEENLVVDIQYPNMDSHYLERYTYENI